LPAPATTAPRGASEPRRLVAAGADELVELQRGARVLARAGTSIELSEGADLVECRLGAGEVLVHVPQGSRGKFAVVTPAMRIEVTGTVFGVSANESGNTAVSVWEGRVEVHEGAARTDVAAGESWPPGAEPLRADGADMARLAASARVAPELLRSVLAARAERIRDAPRVGVQPSSARAKGAAPVEDSFARARRLEVAGDRAAAARLYERVAAGDGSTAEAAAFAAARLYSGLSEHAAVWRVLSSYRARYPDGVYARASDVLWLRSLVAEGDSDGLEREAERFLRNYPDDPRAGQFRAARALDRARRGRCIEARVDLAELEVPVRRHVETLCSASAGARP
jgi:ferric-dicitrate binding protein FerR (iron transport regulator)